MDFRRTLCETWRRAFRNASEVESQESCIHLSVSGTARARPVLRCSPYREEHQENSYKNARKNAYKNGDRLHVSFPRKVYTFQARTGHPGAVQSKNTINADLGHTQISKMRVFTVCYWAPPLPHLSAKSRKQTVCFATIC